MLRKLVDTRKTSLTGVQNSTKNRLAASRLEDDALHIVIGSNSPIGKKLDPPLYNIYLSTPGEKIVPRALGVGIRPYVQYNENRL